MIGTQNVGDVKCYIMSVVIGVSATVSKCLFSYLESILERGSLQNAALLGTALHSS